MYVIYLYYRGVVQLFNLVKQQQRTVEKKLKIVGPSILKQDKVLESFDKKSFINSIDHKNVSIFIGTIKYNKSVILLVCL